MKPTPKQRSESSGSRESNPDLYRYLFDHAHDPILIIRPSDEVVLEANAHACETYGRERDELVGLSLKTVSRDPGAGEERIQEVLMSGSIVHFETVQYRKDGSEMHLEVNASLIEYEGEAAILSINRDVTARKKLEEQFAHSQKMEAMGRLAGGVAHDFNNILTAIMASAELISMKLGDDHDVSNEARTIVDESRRAATLTRQLLAFSRRQPTMPQSIALNDVVRDLERMLDRLLVEKYELALDLENDVGAVMADEGQLQQVIVNLVLNARDAMPGGGTIVVRTRRHEADPVDQRPGAVIGLEVEDTGEGIDTEILQQVFDPFFTTKEASQGTGLGLSTVYGIVTQAEGRISLLSVPGVGTIAHVRFPVGDGLADTARTPSPRGQLSRGDEEILLLEDNPVVRLIARKTLEQAGYTVHEAKDVAEATQLFETLGSRVDLLLSDVVLPDGRGPDIATELTGRRPELPVLLMSGHLEGEQLVEQIRQWAFLAKPFSASELTARVRALLGSQG